MTESTSERVECPICGEGFDPTAAGGWCTNSECGEWQYLGDEVPEPDDSAHPDPSSNDEAVEPGPEANPGDEWIEPSTDAEPTQETVSSSDEAAAAGPEGVSAAAETDSEPSSTDEAGDEELTLEFGTAPGGGGDESAEDKESVDDEMTAEPDDVSTEDRESAAKVCPECGADVAPADAFCAACGAELETASAPASSPQDDTPERLVLTARGQEVPVSPDQTVGREIRRIVTDAGGDEEDAVLIHREHVRFVREDGQFFVVDLGDNPTELNGNRLSKGDREAVEPGDQLALSDVVTLSVERP